MKPFATNQVVSIKVSSQFQQDCYQMDWRNKKKTNFAVFFGEAFNLNAGFQADGLFFDKLGVLHRPLGAR